MKIYLKNRYKVQTVTFRMDGRKQSFFVKDTVDQSQRNPTHMLQFDTREEAQAKCDELNAEVSE